MLSNAGAFRLLAGMAWPQRRLIALVAGLATLFLLIAARLAWMQVVQHDEYAALAGQSRAATVLPPPRGTIRDRNGEALAVSRSGWSVALVYDDFYAPEFDDRGRPRQPVRLLSDAERQRQDGVLRRLADLAGSERSTLEEFRQLVDDHAGKIAREVESIQELRALRDRADEAEARAALAERISNEANLRTDLERTDDAMRRQEIEDRIADERDLMAEVRAEPKMAQRQGYFATILRIRRLRDLARRRVPLLQDVPRAAMLRLETGGDDFLGLRVEAGATRQYPRGAATAAVVGYVDDLNKNFSDLNDDSARRAGAFYAAVLRGDGLCAPGVVDRIGPERFQAFERRGRFREHLYGWIGGVENACDTVLRGRWGGALVVRDARNRVVEEVGRVDAIAGGDVTLTIDARLQQAALAALGDARGAAVMLDARTGEVLCLVSAPSYDPNRLLGGRDASVSADIFQNPRAPLHNRALKGKYPPGSAFKVITAVAGLEEGVIEPDATVECTYLYDLRPGGAGSGRRTLPCGHHHEQIPGYRDVNVTRALEVSCNVFFYTVATRLGGERLEKWAGAFGVGEPTGIDLPGEYRGKRPAGAVYPPDHVNGELALYGIGQHTVATTPLQLARVMAAVANGGTLVSPRVIASGAGDPRREEPGSGAEGGGSRRLPVRESTWRAVREGLRQVVFGPEGTARRAGLAALRAAGKTGTAEVEVAADGGGVRKTNHAWFAGYAPWDAPRVAFALVVEDTPLSGGADAAPRVEALLAETRAAFPEWWASTGGERRKEAAAPAKEAAAPAEEAAAPAKEAAAPAEEAAAPAGEGAGEKGPDPVAGGERP
ncbi:MAG: hypothetical protein HY719_02210 [Planctomycetes bacterium]|nr:hypothetical protein [Planctomycetota bacterium]